MDLATAASIIAATAAISGIALGWFGKSRTVKQDMTKEVERDTRLGTDVEYIKRGIDDMRVEQRVQGQRFDLLTERVTRVEESTKSAHHRIDRMSAGDIHK